MAPPLFFLPESLKTTRLLSVDFTNFGFLVGCSYSMSLCTWLWFSIMPSRLTHVEAVTGLPIKG